MENFDSELLAERNPAYDQAAKMFLSKKRMLAWILKRVVIEFKDVSLKDIEEKYIEGEPEVSTVPVNPDHPASPQNIKGDRNEDSSPTEGKIVFDILFHARAPKSGELITLIINLEAQKRNPSDYPLMKRAVYYASRLISSQKEREFFGKDYGKICKVYTIWLCMNAPSREGSSITTYHLTEKQLHGHHTEKKSLYDLINITTIYLGNRKTTDRLIELLRLLFKKEISAAEKKNRLQQDYDLNLTDDMREELGIMCNLSEGIFENGFDKANRMALNDKRKMMLSLLKNGVKISFVSEASGWSEEDLEKLAIKNNIKVVH